MLDTFPLDVFEQVVYFLDVEVLHLLWQTGSKLLQQRLTNAHLQIETPAPPRWPSRFLLRHPHLHSIVWLADTTLQFLQFDLNVLPSSLRVLEFAIPSDQNAQPVCLATQCPNLTTLSISISNHILKSFLTPFPPALTKLELLRDYSKEVIFSALAIALPPALDSLKISFSVDILQDDVLFKLPLLRKLSLACTTSRLDFLEALPRDLEKLKLTVKSKARAKVFERFWQVLPPSLTHLKLEIASGLVPMLSPALLRPNLTRLVILVGGLVDHPNGGLMDYWKRLPNAEQVRITQYGRNGALPFSRAPRTLKWLTLDQLTYIPSELAQLPSRLTNLLVQSTVAQKSDFPALPPTLRVLAVTNYGYPTMPLGFTEFPESLKVLSLHMHAFHRNTKRLPSGLESLSCPFDAFPPGFGTEHLPESLTSLTIDSHEVGAHTNAFFYAKGTISQLSRLRELVLACSEAPSLCENFVNSICPVAPLKRLLWRYHEPEHVDNEFDYLFSDAPQKPLPPSSYQVRWPASVTELTMPVMQCDATTFASLPPRLRKLGITPYSSSNLNTFLKHEHLPMFPRTIQSLYVGSMLKHLGRGDWEAAGFDIRSTDLIRAPAPRSTLLIPPRDETVEDGEDTDGLNLFLFEEAE